MSENITTALITGGFMLMVIIINEVIHLFRERHIRKKEFFNQFFPERLKAHEEIMRIMTKGGLASTNPETDTISTIKKKVESLSNAAHEAVAAGLIFADRHIEGTLLELITTANEIREYGSTDKKLEPESEIAKAVTHFNSIYYDLLGMLREKSGVKLIEEMFESIHQKRDSQSKYKEKNNS